MTERLNWLTEAVFLPNEKRTKRLNGPHWAYAPEWTCNCLRFQMPLIVWASCHTKGVFKDSILVFKDRCFHIISLNTSLLFRVHNPRNSVHILEKSKLGVPQGTAHCYVAAWAGRQFGGEWLHAHVWLSPFAVHLKLLQCCSSAILQDKMKS